MKIKPVTSAEYILLEQEKLRILRESIKDRMMTKQTYKNVMRWIRILRPRRDCL